MYPVAVPDHEFATRLGTALKAALLYREVTTEELAARAGVSVESVRRWVRGDTNMSAADASTVADVLDVPAELLLRPPTSRAALFGMLSAWDDSRRDAPR